MFHSALPIGRAYKSKNGLRFQIRACPGEIAISFLKKKNLGHFWYHWKELTKTSSVIPKTHFVEQMQAVHASRGAGNSCFQARRGVNSTSSVSRSPPLPGQARWLCEGAHPSSMTTNGAVHTSSGTLTTSKQPILGQTRCEQHFECDPEEYVNPRVSRRPPHAMHVYRTAPRIDSRHLPRTHTSTLTERTSRRNAPPNACSRVADYQKCAEQHRTL